MSNKTNIETREFIVNLKQLVVVRERSALVPLDVESEVVRPGESSTTDLALEGLHPRVFPLREGLTSQAVTTVSDSPRLFSQTWRHIQHSHWRLL